MKRDLLGLSSKTDSMTVKDEATERSKVTRGFGMQRSFSDKVSSVPQFMSFRTTQDEKARNTILDPLTPPGFMTISTAEASDLSQKPFSCGTQLGNQYAMSVYPAQPVNTNPIWPQEAGKMTICNRSNQTAASLHNISFQPHLPSTCQNVVNSTIKPQAHGGVPPISPGSAHSFTSSVVGSANLRNTSKFSGTAVQLTIFYAGSVCVYDNVSPEKAQAIMLLAGNGASPAQNPAAIISESVCWPSKDDGLIIKQIPLSALPSPISVTSHVGSQFRVGTCGTNEFAKGKPIGYSVSPSDHVESHKAVSSVCSMAPTLIRSVGLPQARKASLARFLEKRKERVMSRSPYNVSNKSPDCSTPVFDSVNLSVNSSGSCPLPHIN